ncbi:MAG TPA: MarR family transcriptional regulator [Caulobacteraceae bacterium]|nr:MarR family transcriptional regulator [Caulobacteraceae bacterium]
MIGKQRDAADAGQGPIPEDRDPAEYAGYLLYLAGRLRERALDERLDALGLSATRCRVLGIVRRLKACTMGELSFFSTIDRTTLTRIVDQLTALGLVERSTPPGDRRKVTLALTAKGNRLHQRALAAIQNANRTVFAGVPDDDLRHAVSVLQAAISAVLIDPKDIEMLLNFSRASEA